MKIGIDIGGSHIGVGLINDNAEIIAKVEEDLKKESDMENVLIEYIVKSIKSLLIQENIEAKEIEKIGIAIPGVIKENKVYNCNNLGLNDVDLVEKLKKYYNTDIQIRNDAKCAAICEKEFGALKGFKDCVFLCMGTGIGGAVFLQNQLLKPESSDGFELGHMVIEKDGSKCSCGNYGCFESYCSMKKLRTEIIGALKLEHDIKTSDIISLIDKDEVRKIIDEYVDKLSVGIANIVNIFSPEGICFGGSLVYIKDLILPKLEEKLKEKKLKFNINNLKYLTAEFENDAGIIGSVLE